MISVEKAMRNLLTGFKQR